MPIEAKHTTRKRQQKALYNEYFYDTVKVSKD